MKTETQSQFAELYEGVELYEVSESHDSSAFKREGKNLKEILVLVDGELGTTERELFVKILSALGLAFDDVVLVSFSEKKYPAFSSLKANLNFKKMIGLGVSPEMLAIHVSSGLNKVIILHETDMLFSYSLKALMADKVKKDALWKSLKKMFGLQNV